MPRKRNEVLVEWMDKSCEGQTNRVNVKHLLADAEDITVGAILTARMNSKRYKGRVTDLLEWSAPTKSKRKAASARNKKAAPEARTAEAARDENVKGAPKRTGKNAAPDQSLKKAATAKSSKQAKGKKTNKKAQKSTWLAVGDAATEELADTEDNNTLTTEEEEEEEVHCGNLTCGELLSKQESLQACDTPP